MILIKYIHPKYSISAIFLENTVALYARQKAFKFKNKLLWNLRPLIGLVRLFALICSYPDYCSKCFWSDAKLALNDVENAVLFYQSRFLDQFALSLRRRASIFRISTRSEYYNLRFKCWSEEFDCSNVMSNARYFHSRFFHSFLV